MRHIAVVRIIGSVVVALALLLVIAPVALAMAVQQHMVAPPSAYLRLGVVEIMAYRTHYPDCPPRMPCLPESVAPPGTYYVLWVVDETATANQPYGWTARRMLNVSLR